MNKKVNIWPLVIFLSLSCRPAREVVIRDEQTTRQYAGLVWGADSSSHLWHFTSDSAFFYHPDSGLWAYSGILGGRQVQTRQTVQREFRDSTAYVRDSRETQQDKTILTGVKGYRWWLLMAVGIAIGYFLSRAYKLTTYRWYWNRNQRDSLEE